MKRYHKCLKCEEISSAEPDECWKCSFCSSEVYYPEILEKWSDGQYIRYVVRGTVFVSPKWKRIHEAH